MKKFSFLFPVALLLMVTFLLYAPGLTGGYIFDDVSNIANNEKIAIESLDVQTLNAAFWSGKSGPLGRPVSMLSFAFNHYFTGFDPYLFKLTNLGIHLLNVVLVFWLVHTLLRAIPSNKHPAVHLPYYGALLAATLWGLHPLNLTSVLYIVQRMTSLSALFGLLALALYATWRSSLQHFSPLRNVLTGLVICLCLLASALSKESGLLFIPLLIWIELLIFKGMNNEQPIKFGRLTLQQLTWGICGLGALFVLFLLPAYVTPESFYNRDFTLSERVLTESRVIFYYLRLFLLPALSEFALFHDDFVISQGLLQPYTTLLSVASLIVITVGGLLLGKKYPLWLFAWGWFLISHMMESTVFSLELVHEHRNYFATVGFLVLLPWLLWHTTLKVRPYVFLIVGLFVAFCGFITWQRALIWAEPLTHAIFEAETHPLSGRANSQLGSVYIDLFEQTRNPHYADLAKQALQKSQSAYNAENNAWFFLINLAYQQNRIPDLAIVQELELRLRDNTFTNTNISNLNAFSRCQFMQECRVPHQEAMRLFAAALENPKTTKRVRSQINQMAGIYIAQNLSDFEQGEAFLTEALRLYEDAKGHLLLVPALRMQGKFRQAREHLERARQLDKKNVYNSEIERELVRLAEVEHNRDSTPETSSGSALQP